MSCMDSPASRTGVRTDREKFVANRHGGKIMARVTSFQLACKDARMAA